MNLVITWILLLIGVLKLSVVNELKIKVNPIGEVKGTIKRDSPHLDLESIEATPSPALMVVPSARPTPLVKRDMILDKLIPLKKTINSYSLFTGLKKIGDQEFLINLPKIDCSELWLIRLEIELVSKEKALGFDDPALLVKIDQNLAYQLDWQQTGPHQLAFNPQFFDNYPQHLSIWSGNQGDELADSFIVLKKVELIKQAEAILVEIEPIKEVVLTHDLDDLYTIEFDSPQSNDLNLDRALNYQLRFSNQPITNNNWDQANLAQVYLPTHFSPHSSGNKELLLVRLPFLSSGYLMIRGVDSTGELAPLGKNIPFLK